MKDFVSGRDINVQELLFMVKAAEANQDRLYMPAMFRNARHGSTLIEAANKCGTAGCLLGEYCIAKRDWFSERFYDSDVNGGEDFDTYREVSERFGISIREMEFLFFGNHLDHTQWAVDATDQSGPKAIRRLRKFLYYKMRKSELLGDYDKARRHEGNSMFCRVTGDEPLEWDDYRNQTGLRAFRNTLRTLARH